MDSCFRQRRRLGEKILLGEGTLFFHDDAVDLIPGDDHETLWLAIRALYQLHSQQ